MSKKPGAARVRTQRSKPRTHKSIELIHSRIPPAQAAQQESEKTGTESLAYAALAFTPSGRPPGKGAASENISAAGTEASRRDVQRRREGTQTHRQAKPLITAEEYAYMKRDLRTIGLLSVLMLTTIIVLAVILN